MSAKKSAPPGTKPTMVSFFDRIINVEFYKHTMDEEAGYMRCERAFVIRSDRLRSEYDFKNSKTSVERAFEEKKKEESSSGDQKTKNKVKKAKDKVMGVYYSGPKPSMRLSLTQLPDTICTQISLTIENMDVEVNIDEFAGMFIEAGYSSGTGTFARFYCDIFSSFIESPNPNGRTTFTGIVGNWLHAGLQTRPYTVRFVTGQYSIRDVVFLVCSYLGIEPRISELPKVMQDYHVKFNPNNDAQTFDYRAQSGYQVMNWLGTILKDTARHLQQSRDKNGRPLLDSKQTIVCRYINGTFEVSTPYLLDEERAKKQHIDLNRITSASFQGGQLSVIAPWNPLLIAGEVFYMKPTYFRGRLTPKSAIKTDIQSTKDLYTAIMVDITFENVGHTNQMRVTAVKADPMYWTAEELAEAEAQLQIPTGKTIPNPNWVEGMPDKEKTIPEMKSVPPDEFIAWQAEQRKNEKASAASMESDYADGSRSIAYVDGDPYAVGDLAGGGLTDIQKEELANRRADGEDLSKAVPVDGVRTVYIEISQATIDRWKKVRPDPSTTEEGGGGGGGGGGGVDAPVNAMTYPDDPARNSSYFKYDDGELPPRDDRKVIMNNPREPGIDLMTSSKNLMLYMANKFLIHTYDIIGLDIIHNQAKTDAVDIYTLVQVFAPLMSYQEWSKDIEEGGLKTTPYWKGSIRSVLCQELANTQAVSFDGDNDFPSATTGSGTELFIVPSFDKTQYINQLAKGYKDYLLSVVKYIDDLVVAGAEFGGLLNKAHYMKKTIENFLYMYSKLGSGGSWIGVTSDGGRITIL